MKPIKPMEVKVALLVAVIVAAIIGTFFGGLAVGAVCAVIGGIVALGEYWKVRGVMQSLKSSKASRATKYDDAEFHNPDGNREEQLAAAHIALFLHWCDGRDLISEQLKGESGTELAQARAGGITYTEFLLSHCDGKLVDEDLSEEGNRFAAAYYDSYLREYSAVCGFPSYSHTELKHDYGAVSTLLDRRLAEFQAGTLTVLRTKWR